MNPLKNKKIKITKDRNKSNAKEDIRNKSKSGLNKKLKVKIKSIDKINNLNYFKDLFPKYEEKGQKSMIYFNFEDFNSQTQSLKIERGVIKKDGSYANPAKFNAKNFDSLKWQISKNVRKVLTYINNTENSELGYYISGLSKNRFYDLGTDLMMPVLKNIYFEEILKF